MVLTQQLQFCQSCVCLERITQRTRSFITNPDVSRTPFCHELSWLCASLWSWCSPCRSSFINTVFVLSASPNARAPSTPKLHPFQNLMQVSLPCSLAVLPCNLSLFCSLSNHSSVSVVFVLSASPSALTCPSPISLSDSTPQLMHMMTSRLLKILFMVVVLTPQLQSCQRRLHPQHQCCHIHTVRSLTMLCGCCGTQGTSVVCLKFNNKCVGCSCVMLMFRLFPLF